METFLNLDGPWAIVIVLAFLAIIFKMATSGFTITEAEHNTLTEGERDLFNRGYIFTTLWKLEDLRQYARELGVYFTHEDYANIIRMIRVDFDPENGLSKGQIITYMHIYIQQNAAKVDYKSPDRLRLGRI
jgi:hypothetical protein